MHVGETYIIILVLNCGIGENELTRGRYLALAQVGQGNISTQHPADIYEDYDIRKRQMDKNRIAQGTHRYRRHVYKTKGYAHISDYRIQF